MIRRPVVDPEIGKQLVSLPKRTDITIEVILSGPEREIYEIIKALPDDTLAKLTRRRQGLKSVSELLSPHLRLLSLVACDHPMLLAKVLGETEQYSGAQIESTVEDDESVDSEEQYVLHAAVFANTYYFPLQIFENNQFCSLPNELYTSSLFLFFFHVCEVACG